MNYEHNSFGMDIILAITSKDEPCANGMKPLSGVNEGFLDALHSKEQEGNYFLSSYYGVSLKPNTVDADRVCRVKEILELEDEEEDEIIVKKYEEF